MNRPRLSRCLPAIASLALGLSPALWAGHAGASELPDHASPSTCVVLIGLALQAGAVDADEEQDYRDASDAYRKISVRLNGDKTASDQMIGSTVNLYAGLGKDELSEGADMCLEAVDETFTEDE